MKTVSMHEAKTHFSRLIKEEFIVTNNGRPVARVIPISDGASRFGFLPESVAESTRVPDDFDEMFTAEIAELFGAEG
ncbi:type II toxin-antitoxin system Phd/YefM family antitoxin [Aestuariimicrobium sp. Y1814]|uniref:type II toxin-antitoxin system Phd/YefM family antitoxin n=1 Tax=Aestuariimicrobium sp. Y1814 TaxID=3418742 RepID=UPI003DA73C0D